MNNPDIFAATERPDPALRYRRADPHDPRLGELAAAGRAGWCRAAQPLR